MAQRCSSGILLVVSRGSATPRQTAMTQFSYGDNGLNVPRRINPS
jgi:hypothetical protein